MERWAKPQLERSQARLFSPTLDDMIAADHPVRLVEEILATQDFSAWEAQYVLLTGQPPIPPRVLAAVVLYGLSHGLRSSRRLEWACKNALDFIWLAEGRPIDHSTICAFRNRFGAELKQLFKDLCGMAMHMGLVRLGQVALDGGKVKANSSRRATASAETIERQAAELGEQIGRMLAEAAATDAREDDLFGTHVSPSHLPRELSDLRRRQQRLNQALEAARKLAGGQPKRAPQNPAESSPSDAQQSHSTPAQPAATPGQSPRTGPSNREGKPKTPRVPVADPESSVQPNKEGGFAPNYTPMLAVDAHAGLIIDAQVLGGQDEGTQVLATVDRIQETLGRKVELLLADTSFGGGTNLAGLEQRGIDSLIGQACRGSAQDPARRADPTQPAPQADWSNLPVNPRSGKLDRSAFVYDAGSDIYHCPMGHRLNFVRVQEKNDGRRGGHYRLYQCDDCPSCPLLDRCVAGKRPRRTVSRDEHERLREQMTERLNSPEGRKQYARRMHVAETPFAFLKQVMGIRQFLHRGLEKVRIEWTWACCGMNLMKLVRAVARWRSRFAAASG